MTLHTTPSQLPTHPISERGDAANAGGGEIGGTEKERKIDERRS